MVAVGFSPYEFTIGGTAPKVGTAGVEERASEDAERQDELAGIAALKRGPGKLQEKHPELAWLEMRGMRNIMAHEYFGVSLPIIWRAIEQDLSPLQDGLNKLLKS